MPLSEQEELELLLLLEEEEGSGGKEKGFQDILPEDVARENAKLKWYDRPRALLQGLTLGGSDELMALGGAGMAKAEQAITGRGDQSFGEIYDDMHQQFQDERESYEKDNMGDALGLNIAGGFGSSGLTLLKLAGKSLLKKGGALAAEGALAGGASADQGDRGKGAAFGAAAAPALGATMKVPGGLWKAMSNRNIKEKLNGRPIHMVVEPDAPGMEGVIGNQYRRAVGGSFGGRSPLKEQQQPIIDAAEKAVTKASVLDDLRTNVNREFDVKKDASQIEFADRVARLNDEALNQTKKVGDIFSDKVDSAKAFPKFTEFNEDKQFREKALDIALPDRVPDADRAALRGAHPDEATSYLNNWWKNNGFDSVKSNTFNWDQDLQKTLKQMVKQDPGLKLALGAVDKKVANMLPTLGVKKGAKTIDGDTLMAMRNYFAIASNDASKVVPKNALRQVANRFDEMIESQLKGDDLAGFQDDLVKWGPTRAWRDSVEKAANTKEGLFGAKEYLRSQKGLRKLEGKADLQPESRKSMRKIADAKENKARAVSELNAQRRQTEGSIRRNKQKKARDVAREAKKEGRRLEYARQDDPRLPAAKARLDKATKALSDTKARGIPEGTSFPSQLITTSVMGAPAAAAATLVGGPIAGLATAAGGAIPGTYISRQLAKKSVQDAVAGQKPWQRKARIGLKRYQDSEQEALAKALRRTLERNAAMNAGDN